KNSKESLKIVTQELIKIANKYRHLSPVLEKRRHDFTQDDHWMKIFSNYINRSIVTDWELKDARKAEIRNHFGRLLRKMHIPRDGIPGIVNEFIETLIDLLGSKSAHAKNG